MAKLQQQLQFVLKLLSGNGIVLVEADGYEAELFMPCIEDRRIHMVNVNPQRRPRLPLKTNNGQNVSQIRTLNGKCVSSNVWRATAGDDNSPLQKWKPNVLIDQRTAKISTNAINKVLQKTATLQSTQNTDSMVETPEAVRHAAPVNVSLSTYFRSSSPHSPILLKRLQTIRTKVATNSKEREKSVIGSSFPGLPMFSTPDVTNKATLTSPFKSHVLSNRKTSQKKGKQKNNLNSSKSITPFNLNASLNNSGFNLPLTPVAAKVPETSIARQRILRKGHVKLNDENNQLVRSPKWRCKVLTPIRTYAKRKTSSPRTTNTKMRSEQSNQRQLQLRKMLPNCLTATTQGVPPMTKVEIPKKRKLILDRKTKLRKRDANEECKPLKSVLQKIDNGKKPAFDLLTNPSRGNTTKLKQQFRKACINKTSSTHRKLKAINKIPLLKFDREVREHLRLRNPKKNVKNRMVDAVERVKKSRIFKLSPN